MTEPNAVAEQTRREAEQLLELTASPAWKLLLQSLEEEQTVYRDVIIRDATNMEDINRYRGILVAYEKFIRMRDTLINLIDSFDREDDDDGS